MVEALGRTVLLRDERRTSGETIVPVNARWLQVEADRNLWPDTGSNVIKVAVEANDGANWREIGHFTAHGGSRLRRDGVTLSPMSAARFNVRLRAGTPVRVVVDSKEALDTAVRLTWG